jgi:predicted N-acetyltransferase YhbS
MATASNFQINHLYEHPAHIDRVAAWIHTEFWADKQIHTPASLAALLRDAARPDSIPLSLLALVDGEPVGTVNLVENDDDKRAHLRPWLAALVVVREQRGRGIGSRLVRKLAGLAATLGYSSMYLGTDNPSFYARQGATVHEQVTNEFAIMQLRCPLEKMLHR